MVSQFVKPVTIKLLFLLIWSNHIATPVVNIIDLLMIPVSLNVLQGIYAVLRFIRNVYKLLLTAVNAVLWAGGGLSIRQKS